MNYGFWEQLPRPFFVLAPMANVTDTAFRQIIAKYGRPNAMFTEFVSANGLCSQKGREALLKDLRFTDEERPIVAQIFSADPEKIYETAKLIVALGFDGLDINMGCPDKAIVKQGAGAGMIKTPELAQAVIRAAQAGVADAGSTIPVTVKTRLGFAKDEADTWIPTLLTTNLPVLTIHGRTAKELSKVPAHWDRIADVVAMAKGSGTLIVGNGDVTTLEDAKNKVAETGVDGIMFGRAIFGNPWFFQENANPPTLEETLHVLMEHTQLYEQTWAGQKSFELMKKHYKSYVARFPGAHDLRMCLMLCHSADDVVREVTAFLSKNQTS